MASSAVREPIYAGRDQAAAVQAFGKAMNAIKKARLIGPEGQEIPIPEPLYRVLEQVIPLLTADMAVSIVPVGHLLTTQEAADLLNVSRPHLIKLLEEGSISFERVGTHRRIRFEDLMEYKHKRDKERRKALRKLTEMAQEAGLYDEE
ncbi:MAG: helix-turn-helix domain-containing protein [Candidatus Obscuribacter phosphatis]|uniref:Helix-turn-helix domain-containing protein n=1 Tax=Candidatus Obscuribacter phosphatis TaxID=1906157 RepID=A0A8J7PJF5_9BACT|nr:helix-turn-helix domain-containing protein [Candidatus Obscuribacter phosphatis]